ncbi:MAG: hypothetical protein M1333_00720 [Patescibacteria group bacterium]|nr:hypothetical protein [Patescibacteria group bacterium]
MIVILVAAAGLFFLFGLLRPGKAMWLKWPVGVMGVAGTVLSGLLFWAYGVQGVPPVIDGERPEPAMYAIALAMMAGIFWFPAIGLWLGRRIGRFIRGFAANFQETNL